MYRTVIEALNNRRDEVYEIMSKEVSNLNFENNSLESFKKVVIIHSASRSGSSLFFDLLKKHPKIMSTSGESVPYYKLAKFVSDESDSDEVSCSEFENDMLSRLNVDMMNDIYSHFETQNSKLSENALIKYKYDLLLRFIIEWPFIEFDPEIFGSHYESVINEFKNVNMDFDVTTFYLKLIKKLREDYEINPYYYDISKPLVEEFFPNIVRKSSPPNKWITIEEPPFILIMPKVELEASDFKNRYLMLKDPVSSYRFDLICKLFPNASIKNIHLTRNPAACTNGLIDGWLDRGFYSANTSHFYDAESKLEIQGYSDIYEWGNNWWNFDRPPGWQKFSTAKLEEVCAFQWKANNDHILEYFESKISPDDALTLKFEEVVGTAEERLQAIEKVESFLGIDRELLNIIDILNLPVVQATKQRGKDRWLMRKKEIMSALIKVDAFSTAVKLGYDKNKILGACK